MSKSSSAMRRMVYLLRMDYRLGRLSRQYLFTAAGTVIFLAHSWSQTSSNLSRENRRRDVNPDMRCASEPFVMGSQSSLSGATRGFEQLFNSCAMSSHWLLV